MSSTAFELGNTQMSGWIYNYLYRRGKVMFHFPKTILPTPLPPIPPNNKIIVLMTSNYPVGYELIQYIINLGLVTSNIECYLQKNGETSLSLVNSYYNNGYRFFIGTQNSQELTELTSFFKTHTNCVYFNTCSTVYNLQMPNNMIRTIVNDYTLIQYINNYFLLNVVELLYLSKFTTMYIPLSETPIGQPAFTKFVYIYEYSLYTNEFLNILLSNQDPELNIIIEHYLIAEEDELPDELIILLTENPVSGPGYRASNKTLFFLNSSTPQSLLDKFTVETWYDNYFFFCDPFFDDILTTNYRFLYTFLGSGVFSSTGYKLSQQIDPNQDISPIALAVVNLIEPLGQWYLNNAKPGTTMVELLNKLMAIQYTFLGNDNNTYWFEKLIYFYHTLYDSDEVISKYKIFKDPLIFSASASPTQNGGVVSIPSGWRSVTFGNDLFVAVSNEGKTMTSTNGSNWIIRNCPVKPWQCICFGGGYFVAVANSSVSSTGLSDGYRMMYSINGINWTLRRADIMGFTSVTYGSNIYVAVANTSPPIANQPSTCRILTGTTITGPLITNCNVPGYPYQSVTYGNGYFVAVSTQGIIARADGGNWSTRNVPSGGWLAVTYGNGLFIVVGNNKIITSPNSINWTERTSPINANWFCITYGNGIFVALASSYGNSMTSPDGITWISRSIPNSLWRSVTFGNGLFVAVASSGPYLTMRSQNGIDWSYGLFGSFLGNGTSYARGTTSKNLAGPNVPFTIEFFVYFQNLDSTRYLFSIGALNTGFLLISYNNTGIKLFGTGVEGSISITNITTSTWYHVAFTRDNNNSYSAYLNGVKQGNDITISSISANYNNVYVGTYHISGASYSLLGNITNLRLTQKIVYTGNFTVPLAPLKAIQPTGINITAINEGECVYLLQCNQTDYLREQITNVNMTNSGLLYSYSEP